MLRVMIAMPPRTVCTTWSRGTNIPCSRCSFQSRVCAEARRSSSPALSAGGAAGSTAATSSRTAATPDITAVWRRACACFSALLFSMYAIIEAMDARAGYQCVLSSRRSCAGKSGKRDLMSVVIRAFDTP